MIETVEVDGGHVPLDMVHWNKLTPNDKPVTPELAEDAVVTVPVPEITVQLPVPTIGTFPFKLAVDAQTV